MKGDRISPFMLRLAASMPVRALRQGKEAFPFLPSKYEKLPSFHIIVKGKEPFRPFPITGALIHVVDCNGLKISLLDGKILLGNLNLGRAHVFSGITHDIGILVYKEYVVRLNACLNVCIVGAVPCSFG